MKKGLAIFALGTGLTLSFAFTSLAGQWVQDAKGWKYQEYDGSYVYTPLEISHEYERIVVDVVNGIEVSDFKVTETTRTPEYRLSYCIDGNNDGIAEIYYFDLDGYLLTDTVVKNGRGEEYHVNSEGARVDNDGNVVTVQVVQGSIDPSIGKNVIPQQYINLLLANLQTVETSTVTTQRRYSYGYEGDVSVQEEYKSNTCVSITLMADKVVTLSGYSNELLTNPNMTVNEISQGLGIAVNENWYKTLTGGYNVIYSWTLQENPKVTLEKRDSLMWISVE